MNVATRADSGGRTTLSLFFTRQNAGVDTADRNPLFSEGEPGNATGYGGDLAFIVLSVPTLAHVFF